MNMNFSTNPAFSVGNGMSNFGMSIPQMTQPMVGMDSQFHFSDKDFSVTILCELKRMAKEYTTASVEATQPSTRQLFERLLKQTLAMEEELHSLMERFGMNDYPFHANREELLERVQHFNDVAFRLHGYMYDRLGNRHNVSGQIEYQNAPGAVASGYGTSGFDAKTHKSFPTFDDQTSFSAPVPPTADSNGSYDHPNQQSSQQQGHGNGLAPMDTEPRSNENRSRSGETTNAPSANPNSEWMKGKDQNVTNEENRSESVNRQKTVGQRDEMKDSTHMNHQKSSSRSVESKASQSQSPFQNQLQFTRSQETLGQSIPKYEASQNEATAPLLTSSDQASSRSANDSEHVQTQSEIRSIENSYEDPMDKYFS